MPSLAKAPRGVHGHRACGRPSLWRRVVLAIGQSLEGRRLRKSTRAKPLRRSKSSTSVIGKPPWTLEARDDSSKDIAMQIDHRWTACSRVHVQAITRLCCACILRVLYKIDMCVMTPRPITIPTKGLSQMGSCLKASLAFSGPGPLEHVHLLQKKNKRGGRRRGGREQGRKGRRLEGGWRCGVIKRASIPPCSRYGSFKWQPPQSQASGRSKLAPAIPTISLRLPPQATKLATTLQGTSNARLDPRSSRPQAATVMWDTPLRRGRPPAPSSGKGSGQGQVQGFSATSCLDGGNWQAGSLSQR